MSEERLNARARRAPTKDLRKMTQDIWLAGLGAFSRAEEEGGKLFDNLVKVGEELEHKTRELTESATSDLKERVLEKATDTRRSVERVLEEGMQQTLSRFGLAGQKEFAAVHERLDRLTAAVEALQQSIDKLQRAG